MRAAVFKVAIGLPSAHGSGLTTRTGFDHAELDQQLAAHTPERVLPVSTKLPNDLHTVIEAHFEEIKALGAAPGGRSKLRRD